MDEEIIREFVFKFKLSLLKLMSVMLLSIHENMVLQNFPVIYSWQKTEILSKMVSVKASVDFTRVSFILIIREAELQIILVTSADMNDII